MCRAGNRVALEGVNVSQGSSLRPGNGGEVGRSRREVAEPAGERG